MSGRTNPLAGLTPYRMAAQLLAEGRPLPEAHRLLIEEGIDPLRAAVVLRYARAKNAQKEGVLIGPPNEGRPPVARRVSVLGRALVAIGTAVLVASVVGQSLVGIWAGPLVALCGLRFVYRDARRPAPAVARPRPVKPQPKTIADRKRPTVRQRVVLRPVGA